jgi:hypothetical protein
MTSIHVFFLSFILSQYLYKEIEESCKIILHALEFLEDAMCI